ncbi:MAG: rhodanese-like domain-containing protein [Sulfuricurvum sp.]|uniref:sulfurtransferase n=1 Tax=Sulfuricurvum sp. TaxID=2025608 RepID=UPI00262F0D25|nr:rhodanese-like domain-containing protein [Sulfuricurvum sp.]MDD2828132.1 rhodanese-like domain-containing protein [Sulfuricurvum sp.]MDD4947994.1 rhodanese-like domain-containing protein [Sulfuricurvum sp.]
MNRLLTTLCLAASLSAANVLAADYVNKDILISAEEAIKLIGNPKVMFVSGDNEDIYKLGHIKGSVEMYAHHLHHSDIDGEMHCAPLYRCIDDAEEVIGKKGISNDMMVIAYDDFKGPNATGVYSFFDSFGHKNVKVLNGGRAAIMAIDPAQKEYDGLNKDLKVATKALKDAKEALKKEGADKASLDATIAKAQADTADLKAKMADVEKRLLVVKGDEVDTPKMYKIDPKKIKYSVIADKNEVKHAMEDILKNGKNSQYVIIDSRGIAEIIGERKMDNVARGGHVPGATFIEWSQISDADKKMSFKSADEIQKVYDNYGVTKDKTIYAYCHVGAGRSSEHITALQLLGYKNVKVFTGSWDVWGNDMNLPIKR